MKKKLVKFIENKIAVPYEDKSGSQHPVLYQIGSDYYYTDGTRVLRSDENIMPNLEAVTKGIILQTFRELFESDASLVELPTIKEIKENIKNLVGTKRTRVIFKPEVNEPRSISYVNARWLVEAMEVLNAQVMYVTRFYVLLFENDNLQSSNAICMLGIRPLLMTDEKTGYYIHE